MKQGKLNYRFHDPNPTEVSADFLLKLFVEVNAVKVETALQNAAAVTNIETCDKTTVHNE